MYFFAEPQDALPSLTHAIPAPEEAEDDEIRRTSTGSRLSDYGILSQTQGNIMIKKSDINKIMKLKQFTT